MRIRQTTIIYIAGIIAAAAFLVLVYMLARDLETRLTAVNIEDESYTTAKDAGVTLLYYQDQAYIYNSALSTLLLMGIDNDELETPTAYRNSGQADLLLLAVFDPDSETCTLIHINRDTMSYVPVYDSLAVYQGVVYEQIGYAHTYGSGWEDSCEYTVEAVANLLLGVTADNYIMLTMDAVATLNDLVGGVTVTIEDDFTGVDDTLVQGETVTLYGEHALTFVRSRMSMVDDGSNLARMRRQQTYMAGFISALQSSIAADSSFLLSAYAEMGDYMLTDCDISTLADLSGELASYTLSDIVSLEGEAVKGETYMEYYVDSQALVELVLDTFYLEYDE